MKRFIFLLVVLTLLLAACAPNNETAAGEFDINNWDSVLSAAKGQTVNWYIWGGSDSINAYVDDFYGVALKERYDITLNRIHGIGQRNTVECDVITFLQCHSIKIIHEGIDAV